MPTLTYPNLGKLPIKPTLQDLFRYGEGGAAYAFPDLSSLFQDAAGTVPVTAPGQQVALARDKSGRGNHLIQPTTLARPTLGRHPVGGRRNLLTNTEDFSGAPWLKPAVTITANATTAPDGTANASKLSPIASGTEKFVYRQVSSLVPAEQNVCSFYAKAAEKGVAYIIDLGGAPSRVCYFNLITGVATLGSYGSNPFMVDAGNGWWWCGYTRSSNGTWLEIGVADAVGSTNVTANGADGIYIFGAQINLGNVRGAYQRVVSDWDVTEEGKRDCYYLGFDGVDDFMVSAAPLDLSATSKLSIFAGVRADLLTGTAAWLELSTLANNNPGTFFASAPLVSSSVQYGSAFAVRGTPGAFPDICFAGFLSTPSAVTYQVDTSALIRSRINGVQAAQIAFTQGGNFASTHKLFVGSRAGTSFFFKGRLYQLAIRGAETADPYVLAVEADLKAKMGVAA